MFFLLSEMFIYSLSMFNLKVLLLYVQRPSSMCLSPREDEEDDGGENTCGPSGLWEALTPCNGCRNLGFSMLAQVYVYLFILKLSNYGIAA